MPFEVGEYAGERAVIALGEWDAEVARAAAKHRCLVLNYALGFRGRDLEFLTADLGIERLYVLARTINDVEPVHRLADTLKALALVSGARNLDLLRLPNLTSLSVDARLVRAQLRAGFVSDVLSDLSLAGYPDADLLPLAGLGRLRSLMLKDRPQVTTLHGLESKSLRSLTVTAASGLTDVAAMGDQGATLERLVLSGCGRVVNWQTLHDLSNVSFFDFSNNGPVSSIEWMAGLSGLERLGQGSRRTSSTATSPSWHACRACATC